MAPVCVAMLIGVAALQTPRLAPASTVAQRMGAPAMVATLENPYQVLGVQYGASTAKVKASFRRLAQKYHPDHNMHDPDKARREFQLITNAYEELTRSERVKRTASRSRNEVVVDIERGWTAGSTQRVTIDGQTITFIVPPGVLPGMKIRLELQQPNGYGGQSPPPPPAPPPAQPQGFFARRRARHAARRAAESAPPAPPEEPRSTVGVRAVFEAINIREWLPTFGSNPPAAVKPSWSFGDMHGNTRCIVTIPEGCRCGDTISIAVPDGRTFRAKVPDGLRTGMTMQVTGRTLPSTPFHSLPLPSTPFHSRLLSFYGR